MSRAKVVCVVPSLQLGGAEKMALDLVTHLDRQLINPVLVSLYSAQGGFYARVTEQRDINTVFLDKRRGLDVSICAKLYRLLNDLKPSVLHTHLYAALYCAPWTIFNRKVRWIHTVHTEASMEMPKAYRLVMKRLYSRRVACPVAISTQIRKTIVTEYGVLEPRVPVIFNGIDTSFFRPGKSRNNRETVQFCCVARFNRAKDHRTLIEAFRVALQTSDRISLKLVGDGELREEIEAQIRNLGLEHRISVLGSRRNVNELLSESDVFVLSSVYEGLPLSVLEAMSSGLPIVATHVGGIPDVIEDGIDGLLVAPGDVTAMAQAIVKIAEDRPLREKMSGSVREKVKKFDVRRMVREYEVLYYAEHNDL